MEYICHYASPLGDILLSADAAGLTGLWFEGQKHYAASLSPDCRETDTQLLMLARQWLDVYFSSHEPDFSVPVHPSGTAFQKEVWALLSAIPYGRTLTYGEIAARLAASRGLAHMSARAVGSAVSRNPISLIIPCHRVLGAGGALNGYAGGLERKAVLLRLEGIGLPGEPR